MSYKFINNLLIQWSDADPCLRSECLDVKNADCIRKDRNDTFCQCKLGFYPVNDGYGKLECVKEHCDENPCPAGHTCEG